MQELSKVNLALNAMATRFELVLTGTDPVHLRAAGEEAFAEIERIEDQLSLYRPGSEIAQVNAGAADRPVRVSPITFELLVRARNLSTATGGAFDPTVAPLVRCWGFMHGSGQRPSDADIAEAKKLTGIDKLHLDAAQSTVQFSQPGMMLDLGSIGKGYALDSAAEILRENGVTNALLHGGTSTVCALGTAGEGMPWKIAIEQPLSPQTTPASVEPPLLTVVEIADEALSVSAVSGKCFVIDSEVYGHVIDPRTGWPCRHALMGAAIVASAEESDALSTAILLSGNADSQQEAEFEKLKSNFPTLRYLQAQRGPDGTLVVRSHGFAGFANSPAG